MTLPHLNTIAETAAKLRCSQSNVYALLARREIGHVRVGAGKGGLRITDEQIEEFLAKRTGAAAPLSMKSDRISLQ